MIVRPTSASRISDADRYTGPRFDGIGQEMPSASDHCPVVIEIEV
ncbi:MAG: hypothetical protein ACRD5B_18755 [Nitrososphaeraceae archaeon]